jgi:pyruvate,water dikinase
MKTMTVVDLADATQVEVLGAKAANLGELIRAGFDIPAGVVLPATLDDADLRSAAREAVARLKGDRFAVRSSATAEDLAQASFAGQYETFLGISREGVADAVRACRESGRALRVAAYREKQGLGDTPSTIAVIVQELVYAIAAGVAFSADPMTGARGRVIVSATKGLGDRLVSGHAMADEWSIEAGKAVRRTGPEEAIDASAALRVAALATAAAHHFGRPQDIEWAIDGDGRLFLLQARPITALPEEVTWESPDGRSYRRNYRLGEWFFEPLTPLFDDWLVSRLEARLHELAHHNYGFPPFERYHVLVNGWFFTDLDVMPDSMPALLSMMLRHNLPRAIRNPRRVAMMMPPAFEFSVRPHYDDFKHRVRPNHRRLVEESQQRVEVAGNDELVGIVDRLADAAGEYFFYIVIVAGYAWKSELQLAKFYRVNLAGSGLTSHQELLLACREPMALPPQVVSLDWFRPLLSAMASSTSADEAAARYNRLVARRNEAESTARAALAERPRLLRRFEKLLTVAQEFASIREELISEFTLAWPVFRRALHCLGEDLVRRKVLADADGIYFLSRAEVMAAQVDLSSVVHDRQEIWDWQRHLTPPLKLGPEKMLVRRMMDDQIDAFRAPATSRGLELLRGVPCSPGIAEGHVRVVKGPEDFDTLLAGEILVAQTTTPGWTPLFARACAVVTDTGSVLAHASLVAREYGIPAVVGTGDATRKLLDGMLVTVDGSAGVVLQNVS